MREFHIAQNDEHQRLDRFLCQAIPLLPASLAQKYIRLKRIKVNGARAQRDQKLVAGDILQCYINDEFFETPSEENVYLTITTRDAIDSYFENEQGKYVFIDTAGMRKKSKVDDVIERYSVLRATMAIDRADVCLIMIDAQEGVTEQDTKVAGLAHDAGKACIIVVNKWDLVDKETGTMEKMRKDVLRDLSFMSYAPVLFISALTGQRTERLFELINFVNDQSAMRITTGMLNNVLADAQARVQPPTDKGRRLKIFYLTQASTRPPTFVAFVNSKQLFHFSYQRYLINQIRENFGLEHTPIRLVIRERGSGEVGAKDV